MDLPQELDDYIKESIDYSLGLPVSTSTLEVKLRASEEAQNRLRINCLALNSRIREKDQLIESVKKEAYMNATALKKFVEVNQILQSERTELLKQCEGLSRECMLYDNDREKLMDFGNEADQRAKEAEARVEELEEAVKGFSDEVQFYKRQYEAILVDTSLKGVTPEDSLLESVLASIPLISEDDGVSARAFLENNSGNESCQKLLEMWMCLKPSTRRALSLVAELKSIQNDKDHLRTNLCRAEEEVKVLFEENNLLDEAYKKLVKYQREKNGHGSSGKHANSASAKSNKRKSSTIEKKIDFSEVETMTRQPLSPLRLNSPDSRVH